MVEFIYKRLSLGQTGYCLQAEEYKKKSYAV